MGGRVTRSSQSRELVRADLRQAVEAGASPGFIAPSIPATAQHSPLSWNRLDQNSEQNAENNSAAVAGQGSPDLQRQFLEQLFENSPDALLIIDPSFRTLCVNREFERLFGYSASESLGQSIDPLILPPDRAAEAVWIAQCLESGQQITLETQRRHRDGTLLDVSVTTAPLIVSGRAVGSYVLYRNISDHKRTAGISSALYRIAEKASCTEDLQQLFASVHSIVDELMPARNFCIALHDPESQQISFPYFVDERDPAPAPAKLGRGLVEYVLRTGKPLLCTPELLKRLQRRGEIQLPHPPTQWLGVPLQVNHHVFGALVVKSYSPTVQLRERDQEVLTLISRQLSATLDHKRNEQALRRSEVRYRSLVQTAVYGMYRSSLEGQFLDVNPALIGMLGYNSALEVLALDPQKDVFLDPNEYSSLVEEFRRSGRMDGFEARWKRKNGDTIIVRISGRAVATEDQPADVLEAIAEDITERRMLEDQFRQSQKMEAVGRLAGGIAHDFNNLLMVVSGYTEVLLDQLPAGHPLQTKAQAIRQASDRATALTRQLLAFSRKQHLELKVIDLNAIVTDMERLLRPLIGEDIEVSTSLAPTTGCTRADAGQLEQVIMNLVVNAKDAMPNGGKLSIRTAAVTLDESYRPENTFIKHGPYVMLSVSDTGHGMDRDTQARVFEPFFTTKEKGKGTGLGLSTVYGIIKQTGGYVFVQSEPGRGSVFTIYFPRVDEPIEALNPNPATLASTGGSETILLVEDEESVRQLIRETLESRGYRILEAENGQAALALAASHPDPIHLVVTDVVMPGLSGHEFIQQLLPARPDAKILYLSGYAEDAVSSPINPGDLKAFLQKPFTLQNLTRKVREVLGSAASN
ncbi:MAG TPA: PAS domain S-box protein [Terriglobales bacterium]|jgi:two-component system cell cycle sensor histidine kinase/response regulator CckA|nr:PAS domain S-box protein [Terriglobales bacterium]